MPEFLEKTFYGNTVYEWLICLAFILGAVVAGKILYWIIGNIVKKITARTRSKLDDLIVDMLEEPVVFGIFLIGAWYGIDFLHLPGELTVLDIKALLDPDQLNALTAKGKELSDFTNGKQIINQIRTILTPEQIEILSSGPTGIKSFVNKVFHILVAINVTWLIARTIDALIREFIVPLTAKTDSTLDDQIIPVVRKGIRSVIWILGIIVALNNAGYNVGALIAGLGIGGLALALAAQDSVKNIFGGIMIFVDKPFKIGERIKIHGFDGTVTEIGLRSTRLETLEGRIVTIPNSTFADQSIENVTREPSRKVKLNLGLTYDTTPEQMEEAIELLKEIAKRHTDQIEDEVLVSFNAFGDFALGILFIYYIKKEGDIMVAQSEVNLDILKTFNSKGLDFAFPTQTILKKELP